PRPSRHARAPPLRRSHRRRARQRHARRLPARARGRADRNEHPLPARTPALVVPRALRRPAGPAGRGARRRRGPLAAALAGALGGRRARRDRRPPPRPRFVRAMKRALRVVATLVVTGLCVAYLVTKIDFGRAWHELSHARLAYFLASLAIMIVTVWPMAWRWQRLLRAKGIEDRLPWLVRAYFVSYMVGQVLPTSIGGDASRIYETTRRHPGNGGPIAGSVLLERALGGAATLLLAAIGFVLAIGRYDVGAYLWVEAAFVVGTIVLAVALFSRAARRPLARVAPLLARLRIDRPLRTVYEGIHSYRGEPALLVGVLALTVFVQAFRVLAIW